MRAFTRIPYKDQIAPATPADVVPPTPQAQSPNVGGTPHSKVQQAAVIARLLGAMAEGTAAKENRHDIILFAAADLVGLVPEMATLLDRIIETIDFADGALPDEQDEATQLLIETRALLSKLKGSK